MRELILSLEGYSLSGSLAVYVADLLALLHSTISFALPKIRVEPLTASK